MKAALDTCTISVRRRTRRFESYRPLNTKMLCQASNNSAKSKQLPMVMRVSRNSDSVFPAGDDLMKNVAIRNASTRADKSKSFAVCFRNCHLLETMGALGHRVFNYKSQSREQNVRSS